MFVDAETSGGTKSRRRATRCPGRSSSSGTIPASLAVGAWLRKTSIDELPQLWNVSARAEMSLVGPRPPLPDEVSRCERWPRRRLSMKPGITCLWQVTRTRVASASRNG